MHVVISGIRIPIKLMSNRQMKNDYGLFDSETESICLRQDQPAVIRRKTLVHECFHAYLYLSGYNELLNSVDDNLEEAMCRSFEQALFHLMRFNKELEDWIEGK